MKNNAKHIRNTLQSLIQDLSRHPEEICHHPGKDFTRKRKLPLETLLTVLVGMGGEPLRNELLAYWDYSPETATVSALVQQRNKLKAEALQTLFRVFVSKTINSKRCDGYRLLAADGTGLQFPTNPDDPDSYVPASEKKSHFSLMHLNALYDLNAGIYLDAVVQKTRKANENSALAEMVDRLEIPGCVIVTADRNYESYNTIAHIHEKGWNYLIRLRDYKGIISKVKLPDTSEFDVSVTVNLTRKQSKAVKNKLGESYRFVYAAAKFDYLPTDSDGVYPMSFRVVRFPVGSDAFETVVTNLDAKAFPASKLRKLYAMRWGIETSFRHLKQTVGLRMLQCKKTEHVFQEIFARLIMYNFTELIISHITIRNADKKLAYKANFAAAVRICKQFIRGKLAPPKVETLILKFLMPIRPGRREARNINRIRFTGFYYRIA